ncbi:MAG: Fic family protein, partial [Elusimicrobiota bacterium]|nr:Fic family protein [Elusimicrobiota bacterium]
MTLLIKLRTEKEARLKGGLYHQTQIRFCYSSNYIEGSRLSEEQTRYIFETNTINTKANETANIDDIIEAVNHFACFDFMLDTADKPLSENIIKDFHHILKSNTSDSKKDWFNVGDYKSKANMVGDSITTDPKYVQKEIADLLSGYLDKETINLEDICSFHYRFEKIHPFQDGNGRVGRIIMFKECLKNNIMPFIIDEEHKSFYY